MDKKKVKKGGSVVNGIFFFSHIFYPHCLRHLLLLLPRQNSELCGKSLNAGLVLSRFRGCLMTISYCLFMSRVQNPDIELSSFPLLFYGFNFYYVIISRQVKYLKFKCLQTVNELLWMTTPSSMAASRFEYNT